MHLVQDRLNEEMVVWCLTLDDSSIEGHRMVPLELLKENELQIKQMLKNQIAVSLCLLANGIPGFPCHPHNQCVSYLDTCLQITNQFSIFLQYCLQTATHKIGSC